MKKQTNIYKDKYSKNTADNISEKAKDTAANIADKLINHTTKEKQLKDDGDYSEGTVQNFISIRSIVDGIVITNDARYISILEFTPIDIEQLNDSGQLAIIRSFTSLFKTGLSKMCIQILTDPYKATELLENIEKANVGETNRERCISLDNYEDFICRVSEDASVTKRFFVITQYENSHLVLEDDIETIIDAMYEQEATIIQTLESCGCKVKLPRHTSDNAKYRKNRTRTTANILYYMFNRNTYRNESLKSRTERIDHDYALYNAQTCSEKFPTFSDYVAPKGLYFDSRNYVQQDGEYYSFLGLKSNTWPSVGQRAWANGLNMGANNLDTILIFERKPQQLTKKAISFQMGNLKARVNQKAKHNNYNAMQEAEAAYQSSVEYLNDLQHNDAYDCSIIFRVRESNPKLLARFKRLVMKIYDPLKFDDAWLNQEDYYRACMPFLYTPLILSRLRHNVSSTNIGWMFPFVSKEVSHPEGVLLGKDEDHQSLFVLNPFDSSYPNSHCLVTGKPGAGKSYFLEMLSHRASLSGLRTHILVPEKPFEYEKLAEITGGKYIKLIPGSHDCINPLEIRLEGTSLDTEGLSDEDRNEILSYMKTSLLAKKVAFLSMWFKLNVYTNKRDEMTSLQESALQQSIIKCYKKFGITEDNKSLYDETGKLREMPILSDWKEFVEQEPEIRSLSYVFREYIEGTSKNLNHPTNVKLDSPLTVYAVDCTLIPKSLLPSYMFLAFETINAIVKEDIYQRDLVVLDEVWRLMDTGNDTTQSKLAEMVYSASKLYRSYFAGLVVATQQQTDFLHGSGVFGKTIVNNSTFRFMMLNTRDAMNELISAQRKSDITDKDIDTIVTLPKGHALVYAGQTKLKVEFTSNEREFAAFNTDRNYR